MERRKYTTSEVVATLAYLAALIALIASGEPARSFISYVVAYLGVLFAFGWFMANTCRRWRQLLEWIMHGDEEE